jgi:hypothetical protein
LPVFCSQTRMSGLLLWVIYFVTAPYPCFGTDFIASVEERIADQRMDKAFPGVAVREL